MFASHLGHTGLLSVDVGESIGKPATGYANDSNISSFSSCQANDVASVCFNLLVLIKM